jgi:hypothetical protein
VQIEKSSKLIPPPFDLGKSQGTLGLPNSQAAHASALLLNCETSIIIWMYLLAHFLHSSLLPLVTFLKAKEKFDLSADAAIYTCLSLLVQQQKQAEETSLEGGNLQHLTMLFSITTQTLPSTFEIALALPPWKMFSSCKKRLSKQGRD